MGAAEKVGTTGLVRLTWATICEHYPREWVCMIDVERAPDGTIQSGRVSHHHRSMKHALAQIDTSQPDTIVVHTAGRPLHPARLEMTDEIRDIVRARR